MGGDLYRRYRQTDISTSSPGQNLILIFGECISNLRKAATVFRYGSSPGAEPNSPTYAADSAGTHIRKAQEILSVLCSMLRDDIDPELCRMLETYYLGTTQIITQAQLNKDWSRLEGVTAQLKVIRNAWIQAVTISEKDKRRPRTKQSLGREKQPLRSTR